MVARLVADGSFRGCDVKPPNLFWFCSRFVLKGFSSEGRDLTDKETQTFLSAADKDGDGKIGIDGETPVCVSMSAKGTYVLQ